MIKRLIFPMVLLLIVSILGMGLGCAAPATPTPTATSTPTVAPVTPGVTPTEVAPGIKPTRIHFAQSYRLDYATGVYAEKFKALLEERSGGKIRVDHYPANQLFAQTDEYHAVGTGAVEMVISSSSVLSVVNNRVWSFQRASVRYWKDAKAFYAFWDDPAGGGYIKALVEKDGVKSLDYGLAASWLDYIVINNRRPIKKVEDWKGLKIAASVGAEWEIAGFGANALPIPNAEMITALQTGMVDGRFSSMSGIISAGWDKVTKYASTYLNYGQRFAMYPLANLAWWNGLNDATRAMVLKAMADSREWVLGVWIPGNDAPVLKQVQASYGKNFYDMHKDDPAEFERHRVIISNLQVEQMKKSLPPEMFNLLETKYLR